MHKRHIRGLSKPRTAQLDELNAIIGLLRSFLALIAESREVLNFDIIRKP